MKIYLSIPISGRSIDAVKKDIEKVRNSFRTKHEVISPLDNVSDYHKPWIDYMVEDLKLLSQCDAICIVQPREVCGKSFGVEIEKLVAQKLDLQILNYFL